MNIISRILKDLAEEFRIPEVIEKNLFWQLFLSKKEKEISEKSKAY